MDEYKDYGMLSYIYMKLFGVFLLACVVLTALQSPAVITQLETTKTSQATDPSAPDHRKASMLEINLTDQKGKPRFRFQAPSGQPIESNDAADIVNALRKAHPAELIVRTDRHVTIGDMDAVILPAREMGVQVWRSNDKK